MPTLIREAAGATKTGPGRVKLTIITPGKGASGTYTADVLEQAAKDRVWPRGTQSHIDHDTAVERMDRPEGSLRNLVGVLLEDAYVDTDGALVAEARISSAWRDFVDDFGEFIGASIVASAEVSKSKEGPVVERLIPSPFNRVDLVTVAGRGGRIAEVLEAAKAIESRSIVRETTASDIDGYLRAAVRDAHKTQDEYAWLQDYDETFVYFEKGGRIWRQTYTLAGVEATLTGEPAEVHRRVEYDPITSTPAVEAATVNVRMDADAFMAEIREAAADGQMPSSDVVSRIAKNHMKLTKTPLPVPAGVQEKKEAATMATTTIEEAELATLRENASRATAAEAELKTERENRAKEAKAARKDKADAIVKEAFGEDAPAFIVESARLLSESEDFDAEALRTSATEAAAKIAEAGGAGTPRGVGDTLVTESKPRTDEDITNALHGKVA